MFAQSCAYCGSFKKPACAPANWSIARPLDLYQSESYSRTRLRSELIVVFIAVPRVTPKTSYRSCSRNTQRRNLFRAPSVLTIIPSAAFGAFV